MSLTRRGRRIAVGSTLTFSALLGLTAHVILPEPPDLVIYEDGSAVLYKGDQEIHTYPPETFPWHCETMGNKICGDIDDGHTVEGNEHRP